MAHEEGTLRIHDKCPIESTEFFEAKQPGGIFSIDMVPDKPYINGSRNDPKPDGNCLHEYAGLSNKETHPNSKTRKEYKLVDIIDTIPNNGGE